ncbi:MAG: N-ethylmaleimide reductase [Betaproteobacteria bacterium]|nr:N-ethylmaleimide reductase [Betaproteobacteria bacterium]
MNSQDLDLFSPYQMGPFRLKNRMVMAPLTRSRAQARNVPSSMAAAYYSARAGAGLIITEATQASAGAQGYISTPGIYSSEQIEAWKKVTAAVNGEGGVIFVQLWHVGRISHPDFRGGELPVAPSAVAPRGMSTFTPEGMKPIPTPRALELGEIPAIVDEFRQAAENAKAAGFDGVEVHGANGYLLDQFLQDCTNQRTDRYGGSVENRARLLLEVVDAVAGVVGQERVGVRLSPGGTFNDMMDCNPEGIFDHVVKRLGERNIVYLHLIEAAQNSGEHPVADLSARHFRPLWPATLIVAGGYTLDRAQEVIRQGLADLVAFGQLFLANPDLPERFRRGAKLNRPEPETFYTGGAKGYIDYPTLEEAEA